MAVPEDIPVTTPEEASTEALTAKLLAQVPPLTELESEDDCPIQIVPDPLIEPGSVTVTTVVAIQPAAVVYDIKAVPEDMPVTAPVEPTVAVAEDVLHVPPEAVFVSVIV
jgi:hypothetical protein